MISKQQRRLLSSYDIGFETATDHGGVFKTLNKEPPEISTWSSLKRGGKVMMKCLRWAKPILVNRIQSDSVVGFVCKYEEDEAGVEQLYIRLLDYMHSVVSFNKLKKKVLFVFCLRVLELLLKHVTVLWWRPELLTCSLALYFSVIWDRRNNTTFLKGQNLGSIHRYLVNN